MSRSLNKLTLLGHLGSDPEVRVTSNGNKVAQFSVATGRQWTDSKGEKQEKTEWHKCVAWNSPKGPKLADVMEAYVSKGDKVYVEGRVEYRQYEDKDKQTRYVTEVNVTEVILLGTKGVASSRPAETPKGGSAKPSSAAATYNGDGPDPDDDLPF